MAVDLWGTFSGVGHLRARPFVADVLLYDRLVVPVPNDEVERGRWAERHRRPELQSELLGILGRRAVAVPWSLDLHAQWTRMFEPDAPRGGGRSERVVDAMSRAVTFDATNVVEARKSSANAEPSQAENPADPGFMVTRIVLADYPNQTRHRALLDEIPAASEVQAVTAYGSYRDLRARKGQVLADLSTGTPVQTLTWPFLVPTDSRRSPTDLLKQAVELAETVEVRGWRRAAHR